MKLSLLELFGVGGGVPGLRPEGPSGANMHQFPHHGLYSKTGGGKPKASNKAPYNDKDSDLAVGDAAAEEEPDLQELPEMKLDEFFKFTKSANDNTSFHRPPTYGSGAPRAYGKSSKEYGAYDPSSDDGEDSTEDRKRKEETMAGRAHQKVGIYENPQMRSREPRDENDYSTKQPFSSGMPGWDKKDIVNGDAKIDELMKDIENDNGDTKIYKESHRGMGWSDTAYSRLNHSKKSRTPESDLRFWDIVSKDNMYLMTDPEEQVDNDKETEEE